MLRWGEADHPTQLGVGGAIPFQALAGLAPRWEWGTPRGGASPRRLRSLCPPGRWQSPRRGRCRGAGALWCASPGWAAPAGRWGCTAAGRPATAPVPPWWLRPASGPRCRTGRVGLHQHPEAFLPSFLYPTTHTHLGPGLQDSDQVAHLRPPPLPSTSE